MPRKDIESRDIKGRFGLKYRPHLGYIMQKFHRISGVFLGIFLLCHIFFNTGIFPGVYAWLKQPSHIGAIAAIFILHALNGVRIIMMEFFNSAERNKYQKHLIVTFVLIGALIVFYIIKGDYISLFIEEFMRMKDGVIG